MDVEVYTEAKVYSPEKILSPLAPYFPEAVRQTVDHEKNHSLADPELATKGGEFGYTAVLVKLPNGLVMASWVAWYQPWGDREPEDMMQIAEAPGRTQMSDQDILIYEQSRKEWIERLKEKQNTVSEENSLAILDIIPGKENENEDEYKKRAEITIKFGQKLEEMTQDGKLPPMDELIDEEFSVIYEKYKDLFNEAYSRAEDEFNWENTSNDEWVVPDNTEKENIKNPFGIIYIASFEDKQPEYAKLPLAV